MCSIRTFGVPYLSPFGPLILKDQKDALVLFPRRALLTRPRLISQKYCQGHKYFDTKKGIKRGMNHVKI